MSASLWANQAKAVLTATGSGAFIPAWRASSRSPSSSAARACSRGASNRVTSVATTALCNGKPTAQAARCMTQVGVSRCHFSVRPLLMPLGKVVMLSRD
ncbi:hypothetical protein D3C79_719290 [compost metagenome]